jgi:tetratricopeptide (TPR) repeat protein
MIANNKGSEVRKILKSVTELELNGKIKEAISEIERAIKVKPQDGNLYNRLGDLYIKNDKTKEAIRSYQKGIKAFKGDYFFRNALALCKKVLRYDPGNVDVYLETAELLVELDEKTDALMYLFNYIEKQVSGGKKKEVKKTVEYIKKLDVKDDKVMEKLSEICKEIGEKELAKEFAVSRPRQKPAPEAAKIPDISAFTHDVELKTEKPVRGAKLREEIDVFKKEEVKLKKDITQLENVIGDVETAVAGLRKAMRLDEIIIALDKSLGALSGEQKKSIALLQKSLNLNLETLQKSIKQLQQGSEKNIKDLDKLLNNLSNSLTDLNKNQSSFVKEINSNLEKVSKNFDATIKTGLKEIKGFTTSYHNATTDMCDKLEKSKESNVSLLKISEDLKVAIHRMNDSLSRSIMAQEIKDKKQNRYIVILIAFVAAICGLFIISLFK